RSALRTWRRPPWRRAPRPASSPRRPPPPTVRARPDRRRARSARFQPERPEADADVETLAGSRKGQRHLALGHGRRLAGLDRAGVCLRRDIGAQHLADVADPGELALAVADRRLAEGQAAALGSDLHREALAVVAGDHALARSGL